MIILLVFVYGIRALNFFSSLAMSSASSSSFQHVSGQRSLVKLKNLYTVKLEETHLQGNSLLWFIENEIGDDDGLVIQQDKLLLGWIFSTITPSILP